MDNIEGRCRVRRMSDLKNRLRDSIHGNPRHNLKNFLADFKVTGETISYTVRSWNGIHVDT